ncbi:MAG: hypothetical protein NVSMB27_34690 [Ktedonobacteraceae bacterium]
MFRRCTSVICTILLCCLVLLSACNGSPVNTSPTPTTGAINRATATAGLAPTQAPTSIPTASPTSGTSPEHFTTRVILQGVGRPDDLVFDNSESVLLFSDFYNGTISRVTLAGKVTVLLSGLGGPEGLVVLPDHTLIIAEQNTNRILALAPGAKSPTVLQTLPGNPGTASCKHGVDGIAWDINTNTLIVPDSPTGEVYRMSLDGKHALTLLASGIVRPVGAAVDSQGNIYVADECGGALWRIAPGGTTTRISGFGMLDDVVIDPHGNVLVTDLLPSIHALIRINSVTGKRETLASQGYIEPQGLLVDSRDDIFVSDDYANKIVEYLPA